MCPPADDLTEIVSRRPRRAKSGKCTVAPAAAKAFAVLYVPRFGADYHRTIAEGTGRDVLNSNQLGIIGHYEETQMPGEVGNFAVAAHRSAFRGGMHLINELQLGDAIYVQTIDGYYTYRYRDTEYVAPSQVQVLASLPNNPDATPVDRIITCGVLESWQPLSAGAPAELAPIIAAQASEAPMSAALWRILPGPIGVRIILVLILVAAVLATWVYPWMDGILNNQEATVGGA